MSHSRLMMVLSAFCCALITIVVTYIQPAIARMQPNSPPVAVDDSYTVHGITNIGPLMANDYDPDGDGKVFHDIVTYPTNGSLAAGTYPDVKIYSPNQGYVGSDIFTYRIRDSLGNVSNTATVTVNVVNNAPIANTDSFTVHASLLMSFTGNDTDPDGDGINFNAIALSLSTAH